MIYGIMLYKALVMTKLEYLFYNIQRNNAQSGTCYIKHSFCISLNTHVLQILIVLNDIHFNAFIVIALKLSFTIIEVFET